jgi:hypothetical protein
MFKQKRLPEIGQRIGAVSGPGQFPEDNAGIVLSLVPSKFGDSVLVLMDDGTTEYCSGLRDEPGIGWHAIKEK